MGTELFFKTSQNQIFSPDTKEEQVKKITEWSNTVGPLPCKTGTFFLTIEKLKIFFYCSIIDLTKLLGHLEFPGNETGTVEIPSLNLSGEKGLWGKGILLKEVYSDRVICASITVSIFFKIFINFIIYLISFVFKNCYS